MTLPVVSRISALDGFFSKPVSTSSSEEISSERYWDSRSAYVGLSGQPIHVATPLIPRNPLACSVGARRASIRSSEEMAGWFAADKCLVQYVLPTPDIPISARRSGLEGGWAIENPKSYWIGGGARKRKENRGLGIDSFAPGLGLYQRETCTCVRVAPL